MSVAASLAAAAITSRLGSPSHPGGLARNRSIGEVAKLSLSSDIWLNLLREIGIGPVAFPPELFFLAAKTLVYELNQIEKIGSTYPQISAAAGDC
jgi:hypothetical protein